MNYMNERSGNRNELPSDDEIRSILIDRIDVRRQGVGIVVGVVDGNGQRVISYGHSGGDDQRPLDGDSVFEIGSITKPFTKLLLVDMALRGEVSLDDPVEMYLPPDVRMPERNGRKITLADLATHSSGLPRDPGDLTPGLTNPYEDYTVARLYRFLSGYDLIRDIGSEREYSNMGFGLLGQALARKAGMDYESLVISRICTPLRMQSTGITLKPEIKTRLAYGHDPGLTPCENWHFPAFEGAASLLSTANDMLIFLSANLGLIESSLTPAIEEMQMKGRQPAGQPGMDISLGWGIWTEKGKNTFWHSGGTGGYCSWMGFDPGRRVGVIVLSNTGWLVDDIGRNILDNDTPLSDPPEKRTEVEVDTTLYKYYTGTYSSGLDFIIEVSHEDDHLFAQATGMAKYEIFPENEKDFFFKTMNAQISFVTGEDGYATEIIFGVDRMYDHIKRVG